MESWETSCTVAAKVSPAFAWAFMTNVENWNDPPATFEIDGPFRAGTRGSTHMPGQAPRQWTVSEHQPPAMYAIEMPLERGALAFEWRFEQAAGAAVLVTQRIVLRAADASTAAQVRSAFEPGLAAGMERIARAMERAESCR